MKSISINNVSWVVKKKERFLDKHYRAEEKQAILRYLRQFQPCWFTTAPVLDPFTGEQVGETNLGYSDGEYTWYESQIYSLEKYDLALTDEFLMCIRKKLNMG